MFERRCSGHCCKSFILPWISPDQLEYKRKFYKNNEDALKVLNMIIYLGNDPNKFPESAKKVIPLGNFKPSSDLYQNHYYTCKHHCNITGNCLIYNDRPEMCRVFPNNETDWKGACAFVGCTKRYTLKQLLQHNIHKLKSAYEVRYSWQIKDFFRNNFAWCFGLESKVDPEYHYYKADALSLRGLRSLNDVERCIIDEACSEESIGEI